MDLALTPPLTDPKGFGGGRQNGRTKRLSPSARVTPGAPSPPSAAVDRACRELLERILERTGADLRDWHADALAPRLKTAASDEKVDGTVGLLERAKTDSTLLTRLAIRLVRLPTTWFAEPKFYRALRLRVAPLLRTYPSVKFWVPGEAGGEEAAALAILLEEESLLGRSRVYVTAPVDEALANIRAGRFDAAGVRAGMADYALAGGHSGLDRYFAWEGDEAILHERLRRQIVVGQHSLASDGSLNEFHVIVCRRTILDFNARLRARAQRLFWDSLPPLGVVVLPPGDPPPSCFEYEAIDAAIGVYRRKC